MIQNYLHSLFSSLSEWQLYLVIETRASVLLYSNFKNGLSNSVPLCLRQVLAYDSHSLMWPNQSIKYHHLPYYSCGHSSQTNVHELYEWCYYANSMLALSPKNSESRDLTGTQESKFVNKYARSSWCRYFSDYILRNTILPFNFLSNGNNG